MTSSNRGPLAGQIGNRNFLSPVGFKFSLAKFPKISFFCNSASIPEISIGTFQQPSYLKQIDVPGEKLTYGDLDIRFLVDENMENYMAVHNWLRGLGFPDDVQEFIDLKNNDTYSPDPSAKNALNEYSDATLFIYNSNFNEIAKVKFKDVFPVSLSTINFSATTDDINYVTAEATFKYSIYDIEVLT